LGGSLVPYLIGTGMTAERGALILSITLGLNIIGKPAFGAAADRFGIRLVYRLNLWVVGCGILCLPYARNASMLATDRNPGRYPGDSDLSCGPAERRNLEPSLTDKIPIRDAVRFAIHAPTPSGFGAYSGFVLLERAEDKPTG